MQLQLFSSSCPETNQPVSWLWGMAQTLNIHNWQAMLLILIPNRNHIEYRTESFAN